MPVMLSFISSLPPKTMVEFSRKWGIIFAQPSLVDELTSFLRFVFAADSCQQYHHFTGGCFAFLLEVFGS